MSSNNTNAANPAPAPAPAANPTSTDQLAALMDFIKVKNELEAVKNELRFAQQQYSAHVSSHQESAAAHNRSVTSLTFANHLHDMAIETVSRNQVETMKSLQAISADLAELKQGLNNWWARNNGGQ